MFTVSISDLSSTRQAASTSSPGGKSAGQTASHPRLHSQPRRIGRYGRQRLQAHQLRARGVRRQAQDGRQQRRAWVPEERVRVQQIRQRPRLHLPEALQQQRLGSCQQPGAVDASCCQRPQNQAQRECRPGVHPREDLHAWKQNPTIHTDDSSEQGHTKEHAYAACLNHMRACMRRTPSPPGPRPRKRACRGTQTSIGSTPCPPARPPACQPCEAGPSQRSPSPGPGQASRQPPCAPSPGSSQLPPAAPRTAATGRRGRPARCLNRWGVQRKASVQGRRPMARALGFDGGRAARETGGPLGPEPP